MLHLKMRITDKLNEYFFDHLMEKEADNQFDYHDTLDPTIKSPVVGRLNSFFAKECKITDAILVASNSDYPLKNEYQIRNFTGGEQIRMY